MAIDDESYNSSTTTTRHAARRRARETASTSFNARRRVVAPRGRSVVGCSPIADVALARALGARLPGKPLRQHQSSSDQAARAPWSYHQDAGAVNSVPMTTIDCTGAAYEAVGTFGTLRSRTTVRSTRSPEATQTPVGCSTSRSRSRTRHATAVRYQSGAAFNTAVEKDPEYAEPTLPVGARVRDRPVEPRAGGSPDVPRQGRSGPYRNCAILARITKALRTSTTVPISP